MVRSETSGSGPSEFRVGTIKINSSNVFDLTNEAYNHIPYTWANKIHIVTQEDFIRREILFKEGDVYDEILIRESERLLRRRPIFRYVIITPQPPLDGKVDIVIKTEDVWTTSIQLGYGTAGGKNFYRAGILEHNFLGYGHTVGAFVRQDIDRFIKGATYEVPYLLGTLWDGFFGYGQDEKGRDWEVRAQKPYRSFLTPTSEGASFRLTNNEDRLFENGDEVANFNHDKAATRFFFSAALAPNQSVANRTGVAYESRTDQFSDFDFKVPLAYPEDRSVKAILGTYEYEENQYEKKRGVQTFDRDEDLNHAWHLEAELGPALRSLGSSEDGLVERIRVERTWILAANHLLYVGSDFDGRHQQGRLFDSIFRLNGQYVLLNWGDDNVLTFRGEMVLGINLPVDRQFLLGGENGLRGYSVRQFSGTKKALFTLENRRVLLYDWLNLVNLGWALFADTGGVWKESQKMETQDFHSDVGIGLRFSPSRAYDPSLIRVDVAYALDDNDRPSRWVLNIGGDFQFGEVERRKFDQ